MVLGLEAIQCLPLCTNPFGAASLAVTRTKY